MKKSDPIRPSHYDGDECMQCIAAFGDPRAFCFGNAIKYLWRLGRKGGSDKVKEDIDKALWYVQWYVTYSGILSPLDAKIVRGLHTISDAAISAYLKNDAYDCRPAIRELQVSHGEL